MVRMEPHPDGHYSLHHFEKDTRIDFVSQGSGEKCEIFKVFIDGEEMLTMNIDDDAPFWFDWPEANFGFLVSVIRAAKKEAEKREDRIFCRMIQELG